MATKEDYLLCSNKFFDKKSSGSGIINDANYQLADELHKPIIIKFNKKKSIFIV